MVETDLLHLAILFAIALIASTIDAMAGGGGLLTLPALMATGLDPVTALATNKFQGTFGSLSATYHFWRTGKLDLIKYFPGALFAFFGSLAGGVVVMEMNPDLLKTIIPFLLIGIACWVLCSPTLGDSRTKAKISFAIYIVFFVTLIGFYDGFFGPGTGSFFALSGVALLGIKLDEATARAKLYNFMSNVASLLFFIIQGKIFWLFASVMAVGNFMGGQIGARLVIHHGTQLIRPILVIMSVAMSIKLLWSQGLLQKCF